MQIEMVACHYLKPGVASCCGRGKPALFVSREQAEEWVYEEVAQWGNSKQSYIVLRRTEASLHRADRSLTMGPPVIRGNAANDLSCMALVAAWAPRVRCV